MIELICPLRRATAAATEAIRRCSKHCLTATAHADDCELSHVLDGDVDDDAFVDDDVEEPPSKRARVQTRRSFRRCR